MSSIGLIMLRIKLQKPWLTTAWRKLDSFIATTLVQAYELPLSPLPVIDGLDFEDYITTEDELVTCVKPDPEANFNEIFSATKQSKDFKAKEMDMKRMIIKVMTKLKRTQLWKMMM